MRPGSVDNNEKYEVRREYNHTDLSVWKNNKAILLIENKVKSLPDKGQLEDYAKKKEFCGDGVKRILLTMSNPDNVSVIGWNVITYGEFSKMLKSNLSEYLLKNTISEESYVSHVLTDYCSLIGNLHEYISSEINFDENDYFYRAVPQYVADDLRLYDVIAKIKYARLANLLRKAINDKLSETHQDMKSGFSVEHKLLMAGPVFECRISLNDHADYLVQIQNQEYHRLVQVKGHKNDAWAAYENNPEHKETRSVIDCYLKGCNNFNPSFATGDPLPKKRNTDTGRKFGEYIYNSWTIGDDKTVSYIINAMADEIINVYKIAHNNN